MSAVLEDTGRKDSQKSYVLQGDGQTYHLNKKAFKAALAAVEEVEQQQEHLIGTGKAAQILGVSRKTVQRILDAGKIDYRRNGPTGNRLMNEADVIAYAQTMKENRHQALDRMRDIAREMGMYDND